MTVAPQKILGAGCRMPLIREPADNAGMNERIKRDIIRIPPPKLFGRDIVRAIAEKHGLTVADLTGPSRLRCIAYPRQEAMWLVRQKTRLSMLRIGVLLGGRDHTTILHGIRAHARRIGERP